MKTIYEESTKWSIICPECRLSCILNINYEKVRIEGKCILNHTFNFSFSEFWDKIFIYFKITINHKYFCNSCFSKLNNSIIFICNNCNNLFCNNCINIHSNEENNKNYSIFKYNELFCLNHNIRYNYFCENCNIKICEKCIKDNIHYKHSFKSFIDIKPNRKERDNIIIKLNNFDIKLNHLLDLCHWNSDKYNWIYIMKKLNQTILKNFNYSILDYYNYLNYNYYLNYINIILNIDNQKIIDYINTGKESEINKILPIQINNNNIIDKNKISPIKNDPRINYSEMIYIKDNIFWGIFFKFIEIYEFDGHSFKYITTMNPTNNFGIEFVKKLDFSGNIVFKERKTRDLYFIKYNESSKRKCDLSLIMNKKGVIKDVIDNKNGNIIIANTKKESILKICRKTNIFNYLTIHININKLYNISNLLFLASGDYNNIIFETENYTIIKKIMTGEYIGNIKDEFFVLKDNNSLYLYSLKFFELFHIINTDNIITEKIINNYLFQVYKEDSNKLKIVKKGLNYKKGIFDDCEILEKNLKGEEEIKLLNIGNQFLALIQNTNGNKFIFISLIKI